ncbi:ATP-binding cassette domain-containing protein [Bacillus aerolatus]|uniref:ATP-binding cassette domain-containing protein n=1 Tax=Bacillus aerolatus TaxID=2653354 RepID=A0A6I1FIF0_9BACI|nr:ATP-binding cassette domain-containing protein [Bacillus aerolatus]KAB7708211.1 ATP-binding cassette domain-containing protein [Bacillus aerolatus]
MSIEKLKTDIAIQFKQAGKCYVNGSEKQMVLQNITGDVPAGAVVTLVGPSGSGKSTLLSLCNLLLTPDEGEVRIEGKEVREWDVNKLRQHAALAFQTAPMIPGTVHDNLMLAARLHDISLQSPEELIQYVGLSKNILPRSAEELSGGQKQRVALARTLVNQSSILMLDEMTSALDPSAAKEIEELIIKIHKDEQKTILWVTHDLEQARRVGDYTWLLANGRLIEKAETHSFFHYPEKELTRRFLQGELAGGKDL